MSRPTSDSLHPAARQAKTVEELGRWKDHWRSRREQEWAGVTPEHREAHRCGGCDHPLGYGPAEGIDGKAWHPGCPAVSANLDSGKDSDLKKTVKFLTARIPNQAGLGGPR